MALLSALRWCGPGSYKRVCRCVSQSVGQSVSVVVRVPSRPCLGRSESMVLVVRERKWELICPGLFLGLRALVFTRVDPCARVCVCRSFRVCVSVSRYVCQCVSLFVYVRQRVTEGLCVLLPA